MIKAKIEVILISKFHPESLIVLDESAAHKGHEGAKQGGGHYRVKIVSKTFNEKTLVERHRLIYQALDELFKNNEIHALAIEALPFSLTAHDPDRSEGSPD